jgi:hypothetical protein
MTGKRNGLKVLGLALSAAISMMAVTAAAAQAGEFRLGAKTFAEEKIASESVTGTVGAGTLLVPGLKLNILCASGDIISATIFAGGTSLASILLLGCKVEGNNFCKIYPTEADRNAKTNAGDLIALGKGSLVLMRLKETDPFSHYLLIEEDARPFTGVWFSKAAEGCVLNSDESVLGFMVAKLPDALTSQKTHEVVPLTQFETEELFPTDVLSYGGQRIWIDGAKTTMELSGAAHKGANWSAE